MTSTLVGRREQLQIWAAADLFVAAHFRFWVGAIFSLALIQAVVAQDSSTDPVPNTEQSTDKKVPDASSAKVPSSADEKTQALLTKASEAFQAGDLPTCEAALLEAKLTDDGLESPGVIIARLFWANGRVGDAIARLDSYLTKNDDPDAYLRLGEIALSSGRLTDAFLLLERTRVLSANQKWSDLRRRNFNRELTRLRGATAQSRDRMDDAVKIYTEHLKNDPELYAAQWELGKVESLQGNVEAGRARMQSACAKDATLMQPEFALAVIYSSRRDDAEAEKWFQTSIRDKTAKLVCFAEYAKWLLMHDRAGDAVALMDKVPEADRDSRDVKFVRGLSARFLKDLDTAESIFSALHQANGEDVESADQLALVLIERADEGKRGRAQQIAEANLRRAPNAETALATAGWVHFRLGSTDIADRLLTQAANNRRITPQTAYYIAKMFDDRGRDEDSLALYQTAVKEPGIFVQRREVEQMLKDKK
jgi:tetratricopeptide (TPR) repeat protein